MKSELSYKKKYEFLSILFLIPLGLKESTVQLYILPLENGREILLEPCNKACLSIVAFLFR